MGVLQETGGRAMKEIDQNNLDTAKIYKKLEEAKPKKDATVTQQPDEVKAE